MTKVENEQEEELSRFGKILLQLLGNKSLSRFSREANIDYSYLHSRVKGQKGGKEALPTLPMVKRIIDFFTERGVHVSPEIKQELFDIAVDLPAGFNVAISDNPSDNASWIWALDIGTAMQEAGFEKLTPEQRELIFSHIELLASMNDTIERCLLEIMPSEVRSSYDAGREVLAEISLKGVTFNPPYVPEKTSRFAKFIRLFGPKPSQFDAKHSRR